MDINGKPRIAYSIELLKIYFHNIKSILLFQQMPKLKCRFTIGFKHYYNRPTELASDQAGKVQTIHHLLRFEENRLKRAMIIFKI